MFFLLCMNYYGTQGAQPSRKRTALLQMKSVKLKRQMVELLKINIPSNSCTLSNKMLKIRVLDRGSSIENTK